MSMNPTAMTRSGRRTCIGATTSVRALINVLLAWWIPQALGTEPVPGEDYIPRLTQWPAIESRLTFSPETERRVDALLSRMTLEEKVGQMVQAEIGEVTPEEVRDWHLGAVLNGGGSCPVDCRKATVKDWLKRADAYWAASVSDAGGRTPVPVMWGVDAVHGHNNVVGATLFPHNIGLGATRDPELVRRIGEAVAREVRVTGLDWTFAPTVAVARDDRWGRTYESFSEDPRLVFHLAGALVTGLQGNLDAHHILATAKHFIGDGGTEKGDDQGDTRVSETWLRNVHAQGYYAALKAGVQTVMASFSSWNGRKIHGEQEVIQGILKDRLGFDGLVISDWNGHAQVPGCSADSCPQAINAGIDMFMIPKREQWQGFIRNTLKQVREGVIPVTRIDDAVRRILRVKARSGLLDAPRPSERPLAGESQWIGNPGHRELAREAVRKSAVLLKNNHRLLPLRPDLRVAITGPGARNLAMQSGGWSVTWQGTDVDNRHFPGGTTVADALRKVLPNAQYIPDADKIAADQFDVVVAVLGETPYAEGQGDLEGVLTLEHARNHPRDLKMLSTLRARHLPVVTVFFSGRPLYTDAELNLSDAFVAAWLPGTEGDGIADLLVADEKGQPRHDFHGRLGFSWPAGPCQTPLNEGDEDYAPRFAYGYGLTYADKVDLPEFQVRTRATGCDQPEIRMASGALPEPLSLFERGRTGEGWVLRIGAPSRWQGVDVAADPGQASRTPEGEVQIRAEDGLSQHSARRVTWSAMGQVYVQTPKSVDGRDMSALYAANSALRFRIRVNRAPEAGMNLGVHCVYPCKGELPVGDLLRKLPAGQWVTLSVPVRCFVMRGTDYTWVNTPFLLFSDGPADVSLEDIRWQPGAAPETPDCTLSEENILPSSPHL